MCLRFCVFISCMYYRVNTQNVLTNDESAKPPLQLNVALPAFAVARRAAVPCCCSAGRAAILPAGPTAANPPHAAAAGEWERETDRRTDTVPIHRCRNRFTALAAAPKSVPLGCVILACTYNILHTCVQCAYCISRLLLKVLLLRDHVPMTPCFLFVGNFKSI